MSVKFWTYVRIAILGGVGAFVFFSRPMPINFWECLLLGIIWTIAAFINGFVHSEFPSHKDTIFKIFPEALPRLFLFIKGYKWVILLLSSLGLPFIVNPVQVDYYLYFIPYLDPDYVPYLFDSIPDQNGLFFPVLYALSWSWDYLLTPFLAGLIFTGGVTYVGHAWSQAQS